MSDPRKEGPPDAGNVRRARERTRIGHVGEIAARRELEQRGYRILALNYRCRQGEADLVAEHGEDLVFIEVKARSGLRHGLPREAVGHTKQQRLGHAALHYCHNHDEGERPVRFDVVEVLLLHGEVAAVVVLPDAFSPEV
jgi:putative endonuclease